MKILVTGGAGFIGSNFINYMLNKYSDYKIVCLDALTYAGNLENLNDVFNNNNFKFVKGDIANKILVDKLFKDEKFDMVINFAAESNVDNSILNPELFLKTNIIGTWTLLEACKNNGNIRFHQISTDEVYGDLPLDKPELLFNEDNLLKTSSPYSASKASADLLVKSYYRTFDLPITISRCSNNYGPHQFPDKLIPIVISNALKNKKIPIYGNGKNVRDWIYVLDHCEAIDLIVHKGKLGEVYNVGGHFEMSTIELTKLILGEMNKSEELITFTEDRKGHDLRYAIDSKKIETELGWKLKTNFSDGIKKTINWYLENKEWLKNIDTKEYQKNNHKFN